MIEILEIQTFLTEHNQDGWLLYDFHGQNPLAQELVGVVDLMISRRWFYWIPRDSEPILILHRIDNIHFPPQPGRRVCYTSWLELHALLKERLKDKTSVMMEYCPLAAIPSQSRVDAGTIELVASCGPKVVGSSELIQYYLCRWNDQQIASHQRAVSLLTSIVHEAFNHVHDLSQAQDSITELQLQQIIVKRLALKGLDPSYAPIVASGIHTSDPHYMPSEHAPFLIQPQQPLMIDLWSKELGPDSAFADITWMAFVGEPIPAEVETVFAVVLRARDAGIRYLETGWRNRATMRGFEVDRCVRQVITEAGFGENFIHRTGHNLGTHHDHGDGVNLDDLESHDVRTLIPGIAFSIEPGIYCEQFGIRSEINVVMTTQGPVVTSPCQKTLVKI